MITKAKVKKNMSQLILIFLLNKQKLKNNFQCNLQNIDSFIVSIAAIWLVEHYTYHLYRNEYIVVKINF